MYLIHKDETISHKDINPENIWLVGKKWKIANFSSVEYSDLKSIINKNKLSLDYFSPKLRLYI